MEREKDLEGEEDVVLALELGEEGDEVGLEEAGDVGAEEAVQAEGVGAEALQLLRGEKALFAHLLFPPPYRQAHRR